jgi:hypothetical protein
MKIVFILTILALVVGCHSSPAKEDMSAHPLNHPNFEIVDYPRSSWDDGLMYHTEVMAYLFNTEPERKLAISKLAAAGYGDGKIDFLYVNGDHIAVNGHVCFNLDEAKKYIQERKMKRVLYTGEADIFPKVVPDSVRIEGVDFWLIDWRK